MAERVRRGEFFLNISTTAEPGKREVQLYAKVPGGGAVFITGFPEATLVAWIMDANPKREGFPARLSARKVEQAVTPKGIGEVLRAMVTAKVEEVDAATKERLRVLGNSWRQDGRTERPSNGNEKPEVDPEPEGDPEPETDPDLEGDVEPEGER